MSVGAPQSVRPRPVSLAAQVESRPPASPKSVALIAFVIALMVVIGHFKLLSGTWVQASIVRRDLVEALQPYVSDAVICATINSWAKL